MEPDELGAVGLPERVRAAIADQDRQAVSRLVDALVAQVRSGDGLAADTVVGVLKELRRVRRFAELLRLADAALLAGVDSPTIGRHYAQGLIEQQLPGAARLVLADVLRLDDPEESVEAQGLLGRVYKQQFLCTESPGRRRALLEAAVEAYLSGFRHSGATWHGINAVALLARAHREGLRLDGHPDPGGEASALAEAVLADLAQTDVEADPWSRQTALEAHLALGNITGPDGVLAQLSALDSAGADTFQLGSLLRQLTEVWQLSPLKHPGTLTLPPLQAALLRAPGGELTVGPAEVAAARGGLPDDAFQKVFGEAGTFNQKWFEELLVRCRGVVQVEDGFDEPQGTGFLVAGRDLHPDYPDVVVLTNAHVVPQQIAAQDAVVSFRGLATPAPPSRVRRLLWSSPRDALDATVLEVDSVPPDARALPFATRVPDPEADPPERIYVIGHPRGVASLRVSVQNNRLLAASDTVLHYVAATQHGSSGSPVFDRRWRVVGLHHAGDQNMRRLDGMGTYPANEGIRADRIRAEISRTGTLTAGGS